MRRGDEIVEAVAPAPPRSTGTGVPLRRSSLPLLAPRVRVPSYDVADLAPGVVHLGLGAFARAHVAVYLHRLAQRTRSADWGVVAAGLSSGGPAGPMAAQDNLWSVTSAGTDRVEVVGVVQDYLDGTGRPERVLARLADPRTRLVTLTVTAPTYDATVGRPGTVFDLLAGALQQRRARGRGPFTVLSCDNLPDSGAAARRAVLAAALRLERAPERPGTRGLVRWIADEVAFPAAMVDRITPPTSMAQRVALRRTHGLDDRLALVAEPFSQWVVADEFCAGRPPLEEVGVDLVRDVGPYVATKTRMLNGAHVALGFLGSRAGHRTAAQAMRDTRVAAQVDRLLREEVAPSLAGTSGIDLDDYRRSVLRRLADDAVSDPLQRLRRRGSVRVRNYLLPSVRDAAEAGRPYPLLLAVLAAWVDDLARAAASRTSLDALEDPVARTLAPLAVRARVDARPLVEAVCGEGGAVPGLATSLRAALADLETESRAAAS